MMETSKNRHSGGGWNPALLLNRLCDFVITALWNCFPDWIPASAGMTTHKFVRGA
jgi:hypothetical protein